VVSAENWIIFGGLGWPAKVDQFWVAITFVSYWKYFFGGYFYRNHQKFLDRQKYF
jgi:hypothetical protein